MVTCNHDACAAARKDNYPLPCVVMRKRLGLIEEWEFANAIGVTTQTLATWRGDNVGPDYSKLGKAVFYTEKEILRWIEARRVALPAPQGGFDGPYMMPAVEQAAVQIETKQ